MVLEAPAGSGNPFEVPFSAEFVHEESGTSLTIPGYHDGENVWKIGFMPTRVGTWRYTTASPEPELDGRTGSLECVPSDLPGLLAGDPDAPRKWRFSDGGHVVPMAFRMEFFSEPGSDADFRRAVTFLRDAVGGHLLETRLLEEYGRFGGRHDFIFQGNWRDHRFDLEVWRRMERRMEILTEAGLGAHVMLYSDDNGRPPWPGQSETEELVIRYAVARLAGYPVLWFNTGIDIGEYRSSQDATWMGDMLRSLDPYGHPVSSREARPPATMGSRTFESRAYPNPARVESMIEAFGTATTPVSFDDAWGENRPSHPDKNHTPADIRRAFWKAVIAGGIGGLVRGGDELPGSYNGFFSIEGFEEELESEQWLRYIPRFVDELGEAFGSMAPAPALAAGVGVYAIADPDRSSIVVLSIGTEDTYDPGGDRIELRLGGQPGRWNGTWFDPRTGAESSAGELEGGATRELTTPTAEDWVLRLTRIGSAG